MKARLALSLLLVVAAVGGCRTAPIHNPTDVLLPVPPNATQEDVGNAIRRAAASLGWAVQDTGPGEMTAMLDVRRHRADILISYTATSYSIRYRYSENLQAEGDTIHRRYNTWIQNLEARIRQQASAIGT